MQHLVHLLTSPGVKILLPFFLFFVASQIFWIVKLRQWKRKLLTRRPLGFWLGVASWVIYALFYFFAVRSFRRMPSPTRLTLLAVLMQAPFQWWVFGSVAGFVVYLLVRGCGVAWHVLAWFFHRRRQRRAGVGVFAEGEAVRCAPKQ